MQGYLDVDMHNHTTGSDGKQSPLLFLLRASNRGKDTVSMSDHDSVKGYTQLKDQVEKFLTYYNNIENDPNMTLEQKAKAKLGGKRLLELLMRIKLLPAAELITAYEGSTIEILGYGVDPEKLESEIKRIHEGLPTPGQLLVEGVNRIIEENGLDVDRYIIDNRADFKRLFFHELLRHPENANWVSNIPGDTEEERAENFSKMYLENPESPLYVDMTVEGDRTTKMVRADFLKMIDANKDRFSFDPQVIEMSHQVSGEFFNEVLKDPKAKALLLDKGVGNLKQFLYGELYNKKSPFYIDLSKAKPSREATIEAIHNSGGKAFLAHPGRYAKLFNVKEALEQGDILEGLDGIEVYYPIHDFEMENFLISVCRQRGLLASGGSDDHKAPVDGPEYKIGSVNIPDIPETAWIKSMMQTGHDFLTSEKGLASQVKRLKSYQGDEER